MAAAPVAQAHVVGVSAQSFAQTPSYAPPMAQAMPVMAAPAMAPQSNLAAMPDPVTVAKQKDGYAAMLDNQLKEGAAALDKQLQYQKDFLHAQADAQKKQYIMQVDNQVKSQENNLHKQHTEQLISLQQQAAQQKAALEQQAMQLTLEYQRKATQEDMQAKLFEMQKNQHEAAARMAEQVRQLQCQAAAPHVQPVQAQAVEAMPEAPPEQPAPVPAGAPVTTAPTQASYVPIPAVAMPYAPPTTFAMPTQGSYVPPPTTVVHQGSYALPPTTIAMPTQSSYVAPPASAYAQYTAPATTIVR